jgi:hypothetical protein
LCCPKILNPGAKKAKSLGWAGIVTSVGESESGGVRIEITIRNDTGDWSTMRAANKPATLKSSDGKSTNCDTVFIGTGGHRLAPGFQTRGYTSGTSDAPQTQLIYVECASAVDTSGATLEIDYVNFDGPLDYYVEIEEENKIEGKLKIELDQVVTDLTYPIGAPVEGVIHDAGYEVTALSDNVVSLLDVQRSDSGLQFTWQNHNPSKFALKTHIGIPPVIGQDGVIYGIYETLDLPEVPLTPAQGSIEWTTEAPAPPDASGLYILLSVESNKPRTYLNYAIDITDQ